MVTTVATEDAEEEEELDTPGDTDQQASPKGDHG